MAEKLRNMTAVYLFREGKLLMLYRVGSRVVAPSWCGVGGHFEQAELNDPRACALRELREETGLTEESLEELRLRYITLRMKNGEIRQNYYFFAGLKPGAAVLGASQLLALTAVRLTRCAACAGTRSRIWTATRRCGAYRRRG